MSELISRRYFSYEKIQVDVQMYAKTHGFAVNFSINGLRNMVYCQCTCKGEYIDERGDQRQRNKSTKKTGCCWRVTVSLPKKSQVSGQEPQWEVRYVHIYSGEKYSIKKGKTTVSTEDSSDVVHHNHPLVQDVKALSKVYH
ncbi:hypothetical protein BDB00DRAFT_791027 [Zychaea mexicana]|uniref:uncharacterized protein n=1 Tax=Zychaea mexicana TaxID=64656 RepID=UPI0022FE3198|nr:uncharacterized protein BDB00DRAFT_791027 [Zychaea mexicana]KAI9489515.1 hypothetical protein BDB00DRAFT_791027 [Zychaea mexicana]